MVTLGSNIVTCYFSHQLVWHQSEAYQKTSVRWQLANSRQTTSRNSNVWWQSFSEAFSLGWNCSVVNPLKCCLCRLITGKTKKGQFVRERPRRQATWVVELKRLCSVCYLPLMCVNLSALMSMKEISSSLVRLPYFAVGLLVWGFRSAVCCDSLGCQGC